MIDSPPTDTSSSLPSEDNDDDDDDDGDRQTGVTNDKVSKTTDDKT